MGRGLGLGFGCLSTSGRSCHAYAFFISGKAWKRMVTKVCFVGEGFTRKPPKYERFIRPMVSVSALALAWVVITISVVSGSPIQESSRHASRTQDHLPPADN